MGVASAALLSEGVPVQRSPSATATPFDSLELFAVQVGFTAEQAVVGIRGDLDARTAPTLHNILVGLAESGHHTMVLDLAATSFLGAGGLGVIAQMGKLLEDFGGALTLRHPPTRVSRLLDITGISSRVLIETADRPDDLQSDLKRVVWNTTRNDVTDATLMSIVALTSVSVDGADGASVSLNRHGRLMTVAASDDTVLRMDDHQYATGEGPCVSASSDGEGYEIPSLADEERWPAFVPRALGEGIASIISTPLVAGQRTIGALNIYSNTAHVFGGAQRELAAIIATHTAHVAADTGPEFTDEQMDARINLALHSRSVLALAQGVLIARHRLTPDEATAVLHRSARGAGTSTLAEAAGIVASATDAQTSETKTSG